jgi:membrane protease YdiL (CAAX protease family)
VYLVAISLICWVHQPNVPIAHVVCFRAAPIGFYPVAILLGISAVLPIDAIYDAILRRYPIAGPDTLSGVFRTPGVASGKLAVVTFVAVGLGPMLEELYFRGALFGCLRRRYSPAVLIGATSAMFAVVHVDWQRYVPVAIAGIAFGAMRHASGSIFPSIVVHMAFNGLSVALMVLETPAEGELGRRSLWVVASGVFALLLLGLTALLAQRFRASKLEPKEDAA